MAFKNKLFIAIGSLFLLATSAFAQQSHRTYATSVVAPDIGIPYATSVVAPDIGIPLSGSGVAYHQLTWNVNGTVSTCTVALDTSADGITWTAGGAISGQTCTSNGQSSVVNVVANYVRINVTAITGGGTVTVAYNGWVTSGGSVSLPTTPTYTLSVSGGLVIAQPSPPGSTVYTNADASVVLSDVISAMSGARGKIYLKPGIYPINSLTQESTGGYSNFALAFWTGTVWDCYPLN